MARTGNHPSCPSLLLWNTALRVEMADVAALRPRCWIDGAIDQDRFPRSQRSGEGLREPLRIDGIGTGVSFSKLSGIVLDTLCGIMPS